LLIVLQIQGLRLHSTCRTAWAEPGEDFERWCEYNGTTLLTRLDFKLVRDLLTFSIKKACDHEFIHKDFLLAKKIGEGRVNCFYKKKACDHEFIHKDFLLPMSGIMQSTKTNTKIEKHLLVLSLSSQIFDFLY
jgi:hypothetical protein